MVINLGQPEPEIDLKRPSPNDFEIVLRECYKCTSGKVFEELVMGFSSEDLAFVHHHHGGKDFWQTIRRVRGHQCDFCCDPRKPRTSLGRCLFRSVNENLVTRQPLFLFCALGSLLDWRWGVDCFFQLGDRIATIDLTTQPDKPDPKADVVVTYDNFRLGQYPEVGKRIAQILSRRRR